VFNDHANTDVDEITIRAMPILIFFGAPNQTQLEDQKLTDKTEHLNLGPDDQMDSYVDHEDVDDLVPGLCEIWEDVAEQASISNEHVNFSQVDNFFNDVGNVRSRPSNEFIQGEPSKVRFAMDEVQETVTKQSDFDPLCFQMFNIHRTGMGLPVFDSSSQLVSPQQLQASSRSTFEPHVPENRTVADAVEYCNIFNSGNVVNQSRSPGGQTLLQIFGNSGSAVAMSAPNTPAMLFHDDRVVSGKLPISPGYAMLHHHAINGPACRSPGSPFLCRVPANSPYTPTRHQTPMCAGPLNGQDQSNFFQFPSVTSPHPSALAYSVVQPHTPRSPYTPRQPKTPGTPSRAYRFQFPPVADSVGCDSPFASNQNEHPPSKPGYHPYAQPLASPHYAQHVQKKQQREHSLKLQREQVDQVLEQHIQQFQQRDLEQQQVTQLPHHDMEMSLSCAEEVKSDDRLVNSALGGTVEHGKITFIPASSSLTSSGGSVSDQSPAHPAFYFNMEEEGDQSILGSSNQFDMDMDVNQDLNQEAMTRLMSPCEEDLRPDDVFRLLSDVITDVDLDLGHLPKMDDLEESSFLGTVDFTSTGSADKHAKSVYFDVSDRHANEFYKTPSVDAPPREPAAVARKEKRRPMPLVIPSNVNNYGFASQLRSPKLCDGSFSAGGRPGRTPPPYTPLPMISPVRGGSGTFWATTKRSLRERFWVPPLSAPAFVHQKST